MKNGRLSDWSRLELHPAARKLYWRQHSATSFVGKEMMMNRKQSGFTLVQGIIAVVVLLAIAGGVYYFVSDVGRTRINAAMNQFAHWTPENIAKDPENYLNFCEEQTNNAIVGLKANEISIAQSKGKLQGTLEATENKVRLGDKTVTELKDLYATTEKANAWPCKWLGQDRDKDWMKLQIVSLYNTTERNKKLQATVETGLKTLDVQNTRVQDARGKAQEQLADIKVNREMLKVNKITNELTDRLVSMKAVLQTSIIPASDSKAIISLDTLVEQSAAAPDDSAFDKIMGKSATTKPN